jgi:hypothetical protein
MNLHFRALIVFLVALIATLLWGPTNRAAGGDIHYLFDFNDGKVPTILDVSKYNLGDPPTASLTYSATSGRLQIKDTASKACGVGLSLHQEFTDTHLSTMLNLQGGFPGAVYYMMARDRNFLGHDSQYICGLQPAANRSEVALSIVKWVNGQQVYETDVYLKGSTGPYLMQFDVVDGVSATGQGYTDLTGELSTNNGTVTKDISVRDWGNNLGGDRIPSGEVSFGAALYTDHRNAGWILNGTFDDMSITATPVPEPGTLALLCAGTVGLLAFHWRRKTRTA